jgi:hypothetical protein
MKLLRFFCAAGILLCAAAIGRLVPGSVPRVEVIALLLGVAILSFIIGQIDAEAP